MKLDYDYSKYLGPDYKATQETKRESTIISNHMSWLDGPIMYLHFGTSFCPMAGLKKVTLFGTVAQALNCIFIPRGGKEEVR